MLNYGEFSMSINGKPTWVSHAFANENTVRCMRPKRRRFAHCKCKNVALTLDLGLQPRSRVRAVFSQSQCASHYFGLVYRNILMHNNNAEKLFENMLIKLFDK